MKRKLIALGLVFAMALPMAPTANAYQGYSDWAKYELEEASMLEIIPESMDEGSMIDEITREEMCKIAVIAYEKVTGNELIPSRTDHFSDTDDEDICAAYEMGIVSGYTDGTFQPDNLLNRQEFFMILSNFLECNGVATYITQDYLDGFADVDDVAEWAEEAAQVVVGTGLVQGTIADDGSSILNPLGTTTRQEALIMFLRGYKNTNYYLTAEWLTLEDITALEEAAAEAGASEEVQALVNYALSKIGLAYVFGATGPNSFDCSGFVQHVYANAGYSINRIAADQANNGVAVEKDNLQPGDLVFFANTYYSSDWITHVGIYIGDGKFVHAANSTRGVTVDYLSTTYYATRYAGARRIIVN
ncbi:MAG: NlpC/P60 family protein [Eubacteriales bacterium]